jgi:hypothetical protein
MRYLWLIVPVLALGCDSATRPDPSDLAVGRPDLGEPFQLHVGERAVLEAIDLDVRFLEVASDSRCPSNALILCVWQGDAAVVVETSPIGADAQHHTLHTTLDPKAVRLGSVRLTLQSLDPYPKETTPLPSEAYVATLVVEIVD